MKTIKQASIKFIADELKEYLGLRFYINFRPCSFGFVSDFKSMSVGLIYSPNWDEWIKAQFITIFTTWHNDNEINMFDVPENEREMRVLEALKKRPISAVLESAMFQFWIRNIPRTMSHQIVRHEHSGMSFNQQSYRVSPLHHADIRVPSSYSAVDKVNINDKFNVLRKKYLTDIENGIPIEEARNIIPDGVCTNLVMTTNLKNLIAYVKARSLDIAQDEHTFILTRIIKELKTISPKFYNSFIKSDKIEELINNYDN
jgi:flavin-dependent thymidylate synthase